MLICVQRFRNKRVGKKHCILASQWYFYLFIRTEHCSKYQWLAHCADYLSRCTCMLYSPYPELHLYIRIVFKQLQCCFVCAHILLLLLFLCNTELIYDWCTIKKLLCYYKKSTYCGFISIQGYQFSWMKWRIRKFKANDHINTKS